MSNSVKTVGNIFIIIFLSKLLGQAREMMLAAYYGTGEAAQAFLTATQIPLNFFDIILGVAIVSAFVPVFNEYYVSGGLKEANRFANNFVGIVTVISVAVSVLGVVFSFAITAFLASGLSDAALDMASKLLKIMFPSMIFTAVAYSYAGVLQSLGQFKIPAAMSLVSNTVAIIYLLTLNSRAGVYGLAVSMLIGWMLQLVILLPSLIKKGFKFGISFRFADEGMKKVYRLALPILLSSWVQPLNVMFNTYIASFLNGGEAVAALNYANKLYIIIAGVFTMSVTNLILPSLSRDFSAGKTDSCAATIKNSVNSVILFLMPVMALFIVFHYQIIEIIYQRGTFDEGAAALTASALLYYSFGMIGYGLQEVLNKSFYAMQKSKIPMRTAFLTIAVNISLSLALKGLLGIKGLALASAIAATVGGMVLLIMIKKHVPLIRVKDIIITLTKSLLSAAISGVAAYMLYRAFFNGFHGIALLASLAVCGIFAVAVYCVLLLVFKVEEIKMLKSFIKK